MKRFGFFLLLASASLSFFSLPAQAAVTRYSLLHAAEVSAPATPHIGTGLQQINLCAYGDCEARGSFAADPYGWPNPATLTYLFGFISQGIVLSGGYFSANAGDIGADVESGTATVALNPFVFQMNAIIAAGGGAIRDLPGVNLDANIKVLRSSLALDLTRYGLKGFSLGVIYSWPMMASNIDVTIPAFGLTLNHTRERRLVDVTVGAAWFGGQEKWISVGGYINPIIMRDETISIDPFTLTEGHSRTTENLLFARFGFSVQPGIPLGVEANSPLSELLREVRFGADVEYRNFTVPGEGTTKKEIGYFGVDFRVLPDAWNPLSRYFRLYGIAGIDTTGGYGAGPGIYGSNRDGDFWWTALSCNGAVSERPLLEGSGFANSLRTVAFGCSGTIRIK